LHSGFLSENDQFAERVEEAGLTWAGPSSRVIRQFGLKHTARVLAVNAGVSLVPAVGGKVCTFDIGMAAERRSRCSALQVPVIQGTDLLSSAEEALKAAEIIGFPVSALRRFDLLLLHL
jgi:biotin carboxylase